jgi:hypothetical protein
VSGKAIVFERGSEISGCQIVAFRSAKVAYLEVFTDSGNRTLTTTGTTAKYAKQAKNQAVKLLHLFAYFVCFAVVHRHDSTHRQSCETLLSPRRATFAERKATIFTNNVSARTFYADQRSGFENHAAAWL